MKNTLKYLLIVAFSVSVTFLTSCHKSGADKNNEAVESEKQMVKHDETPMLTVSKSQFAASSMKIGSPQIFQFQQSISANAYIEASPNGKAQLSSYIAGKVKEILVSPGQAVEKGQNLISIESNEIIQLQQDYAENAAALIYAESNLKRQKVLAEENINAKKELIRTESEYNSLLAISNGLRTRLKLLRIDPSKVEKGNIVSNISLISPMKGYISSLNVVIGKSIDTNECLAEIIDKDQLQLNIFVFKKDIDLLKPGQNVKYYDPDDPEKIYSALLSQVGVSIDNNTKTISCYAKIADSEKGKFINRTFVETEIVTSELETMAIPAESLVLKDNLYYIYLKTGEQGDLIQFKMVPVKIGVIQKGLAEVLMDDLEGILINGVYNLAGE